MGAAPPFLLALVGWFAWHLFEFRRWSPSSESDGHPSECPEASIGGDVTTRSLSPSSAHYIGQNFCFLGIKRKYSCIFF